MRTIDMKGYCGRPSQGWILLGLLLMALPLSAKTFRVYVTNHAGETVDVIDPATNKIVQVIEGVEVPHDDKLTRMTQVIFITAVAILGPSVSLGWAQTATQPPADHPEVTVHG